MRRRVRLTSSTARIGHQGDGARQSIETAMIPPPANCWVKLRKTSAPRRVATTRTASSDRSCMHQMVIGGVPPAPAAFDGQFIQMDVIAVTAR